MARLRAEPKSVFSWGFSLFMGDVPVATMDMAWLREGGAFVWQETEFTLTREHLWSGDFLLQTGGQILARATKPSPLLRRFDIHLGERTLRLEAVSAFTRRFRLVESDTVVGTVEPDHPFARRCTVDFPGDLIVPVDVFLFWLVALMWRRAANASAASP